MKIAMTWGARKAANSCRVKSSWPGGEKRAQVGRETVHGKHNVLVVDDDANLTRLMATILRTSGMEPLTATDGYTALEAFAEHNIDAIVLDVEMPKMDGRGFFRELRARGIQTPVLIASAYDAREV